MKSDTLQYYMHSGPSAFRFELAGDLHDEGAQWLEKDWVRACSVIGTRTLIVDLTFVTGAEDEGRRQLSRWYAAGVRFVAESRVSRELAEAIVGEMLPEFAPTDDAGADRTWQPFGVFPA